MAEELEKTVSVSGKLGLHGRPAAQIVQMISAYDAEVTLRKPGDAPVDCRSVLALLMLAATEGSELVLHASGSQAAQAFQAVADFFERGFDEKDV